MVLGLFFAGLKWREKYKQRLPQPEERKIRIWPHDRVGDIIILGAIFGFLGAKIFNSLETWDDFVRIPLDLCFFQRAYILWRTDPRCLVDLVFWQKT